MKSPSPSLLPLLRSRAQGDVLAWIVLHPEEEFSLTEISDATGVSVPTVMREVQKLLDAGLVYERRIGNTRRIRAVTQGPVFGPLSELMAVTFGPTTVLREVLAKVPGVELAFIYGSWAARYEQQPGPVPGDIDVMIVGSADRHQVYEAIEAVERRLRRDVSVRIVSREAWAADESSFARTVMDRPRVVLVGDVNE